MLKDRDWEAAWSPYDASVYGEALALLRADDVVYDIGAGDLRFAVRAAAKVCRVVAVERNAAVLGRACAPFPPNLTVVVADARSHAVPAGATVGVLLMRHCRHFSEYHRKLQAAGCGRLITNARWGMGVESLDLHDVPSFEVAPEGWYACACGVVGLKAGRVEDISEAVLHRQTSVGDCPACRPTRDRKGA